MLAVMGLVALLAGACTKDDCKYCYYSKDGQEVALGELCGEEVKTIEDSGFDIGGVNYDGYCKD